MSFKEKTRRVRDWASDVYWPQVVGLSAIYLAIGFVIALICYFSGYAGIPSDQQFGSELIGMMLMWPLIVLDWLWVVLSNIPEGIGEALDMIFRS